MAATSGSRRPSLPISPQPSALLLAIYPATLLLGSIYSRISPTAVPNSPLSTSSQSAEPVNYFARKDNIFNVYFVKIGWLWTTLAFMFILLTQSAFRNRRIHPNCRLRRAGQALLRYSLVTLSWILTTQWCFGPAVIDRSFIVTGGKCERIQSMEAASHTLRDPEIILTSVLCKAAGGTWEGGHDVSGHAFMLVLASAFLMLELLGSLGPKDGAESPKDKDNTEQTTNRSQDDSLPKLSRNFVWAVAGLSWWMLLMTGIWFHTWLEKVSIKIACSCSTHLCLLFELILS